MSPPTVAAAPERRSQHTAEEGVDLSQLVQALAQKLDDSAIRERWYPGFAATASFDDLPYYRVTGINSPRDWLEAALVRPPGVRFELSNWLDLEEVEDDAARGMHVSSGSPAKSRTSRSASMVTELRAAAAGVMGGAVVAAGLVLSFQALMDHAARPNPFIALALLLGGIAIVTSTIVAIRESHL